HGSNAWSVRRSASRNRSRCTTLSLACSSIGMPLDCLSKMVISTSRTLPYEILSYPMFAVLTHHRPHATLRYSEYCLLSTQQRALGAIPVQKQMYKLHRPHLAAGYLAQ